MSDTKPSAASLKLAREIWDATVDTGNTVYAAALALDAARAEGADEAVARLGQWEAHTGRQPTLAARLREAQELLDDCASALAWVGSSPEAPDLIERIRAFRELVAAGRSVPA